MLLKMKTREQAMNPRLEVSCQDVKSTSNEAEESTLTIFTSS